MADTRYQQLAKTDRNPVEEEEFQRLSSQQGDFGGNDLASLAKQTMDLQRQAAQPAIQSLQASIPETQQRFDTQREQLGGERENLKKRYDTLLNEISRRESVDVSGQEKVTSNEFGRRGIPLSSGVFEQTLQDKLSPIRQFYTGQAASTGLEKESGIQNINNLLANLTGQETDATRGIQNAIAQLQAGGGSQAINQALGLLAQQQQQQQFQESQGLARDQFGLQERAQNFAEQGQQNDPFDRFVTLGEGSSLFDLITGQNVFKNPKTFKAEGGGDPLGLF
jgi:hypothetical protein